MKLTYLQLDTHLAKSLACAYLVSGDEPFLKNEALAHIRKAASARGFSERIRLNLQSNMDATQLFHALYTPSFFAEKRLVEIDCHDSLPNKDLARILEEYAAKPEAEVTLLFSMAKVDAKLAKTAWFKAYEKCGIHVAIWPITAEQMPAWLSQRAHKYKLSLTPAALQLLSDAVAGNLTAAAQAIEKLYLLKHDADINEDMIFHILQDDSRFSVFDLIDPLLAKDSKQAIQVLTNLKAEGLDPTLVLWGLTRELRQLQELSEHALTNTTPIASLFAKYRIFPRRQPLIRRFLQEASKAQCLLWLKQAAQIDCLLKGCLPGNTWQALELYCLQIAMR